MTESEVKETIQTLANNPPSYSVSEFVSEFEAIIGRKPSVAEKLTFQRTRPNPLIRTLSASSISGPLPVGIDLGTTYSCVAVWRNDAVEIIPNEQGNRTTPSWVAFTPVERFIGDGAQNHAINDPVNALFDSKRMIGRRFADAEVQEDLKHWPFNVVQRNGKPVYSVLYRGQRKEFTPEEISSMVLAKLKEFSEAYLGYQITDAVITCPAAFNDSQRQATKDAGRVAGLNVLQMINEPTATAIAYGLNRRPEKENILVFDYGGGTVDVSILTLKSGLFEVKATAGNSHLGGQDIDMLLVKEMAEEFKRKYGRSLTGDAKSVGRLRAACEKAKRALSSQSQATIEVNALFDQKDFSAVLTRARLNMICEPQFVRCMEPVERALADSNLRSEDIAEVVMVGGSSRIPRIQELVRARFAGKEICRSINPDEAIAYGAAVQAAIVKKTIGWRGQDMLLRDVTPLSLGIETQGGLMRVVVKRNTPIPNSTTLQNCVTAMDYQNNMGIHVYEGERELVRGNNLLGQFTLEGITRALIGVTKAEVRFDIDVSGILEVTATETSTTNSKKITIANLSGRLTEYEIQQMVEQGQRFKQDDQRRKVTIEARNGLESVVFSLRTALGEGRTRLNRASKELLEARVNETVAWLGMDRSRTSNDEYAARAAELNLWSAKL